MEAGVSRLLGTLIGGLLGLLCVSVTTYWGHPVVLVLVCGVGTLACIYLCNVLNRAQRLRHLSDRVLFHHAFSQ